MKIRKAQTMLDLKAVWALTYQTYYREGYAEARPHGLFPHYPHLDVLAETTIYMAEDDMETLLGTVSITEDGPGGLQVDSDFNDLANGIRAECKRDGLRLGSPWRMTTQPNTSGSLRVFMALLGTLTTHLEENKIDVSLFTFNPKHVSFYTKIWNLRILAKRDAHAVKNAPGVLMRGDLSRMVAQWNGLIERRKKKNAKPARTKVRGLVGMAL